MTYLLDVNVLIALIDPAHIHHDAAHEWFPITRKTGWATCALTENALLRIVGSPSYPNSPGPPSVVLPILKDIRAVAGHQFWPEATSLLDETIFHAHRLTASKQITDTYLLGLAKRYDGMLATFDRKLTPDAVIDGEAHLHLIES